MQGQGRAGREQRARSSGGQGGGAGNKQLSAPGHRMHRGVAGKGTRFDRSLSGDHFLSTRVCILVAQSCPVFPDEIPGQVSLTLSSLLSVPSPFSRHDKYTDPAQCCRLHLAVMLWPRLHSQGLATGGQHWAGWQTAGKGGTAPQSQPAGPRASLLLLA